MIAMVHKIDRLPSRPMITVATGGPAIQAKEKTSRVGMICATLAPSAR